MAVYPDRIVLKNSTDQRAIIESQINSTGDSPIAQGEIVLGVGNSDVRLYTKAANGDIVSLGSTNDTPLIISTTEPTLNNNGLPLVEGDLWFDPSTGILSTYYEAAWLPMISSGSPPVQALGSLSDVDLAGVANGDLLGYDSLVGAWTNRPSDLFGSVNYVDITGTNDVDVQGDPVTDSGTFQLSLSDTTVVAGSYSAANVVVDSKGRITAISNGNSGSNPLNSLDALNDVSTAGEQVGDLLQLGGSGFYRPRSISEVIQGENSENRFVDVAYSTQELAGIDGFYINQAALEADGFTFIAGSIDADAGGFYLNGSVPSAYLSVDYLGQGLGPFTTLYLSNNCSISISTGSVFVGAGSQDLESTPSSLELFVAAFMEDAETRLAGWKEHVAYGTTWLVIRGDIKQRYFRDNGGFPVEYWLGQNGQIRVHVGQPVGLFDPYEVSPVKQGVASLGTVIATGELTSATGRSQTIYDSFSYAGAELEDLTDVETVDATDGQVLAWSQADGAWKPTTVNGIPTSGGNIGFYSTESQFATAGICQFSSIGASGILQKIFASSDAWVVLYSSSVARTEDSSRSYGVTPADGSGVLAEYNLTGGLETLASPGTSYFNSDSIPLNAIYAAVRTLAGVNLETTVTLSVYGMSGVNVIRGGSFGSGL